MTRLTVAGIIIAGFLFISGLYLGLALGVMIGHRTARTSSSELLTSSR